MAIKKVTEIPTIDVNLVTVKVEGSDTEYIFDTANSIEVAPETEEEDAVKLVIKGVLKAQKPSVMTITGNTITLTDNVFAPELVKILQGGTIKYWTDAEHSSTSDTETGFGVAGYTPPVAGSNEKGATFELNAYSAQYNAAGEIVQFEKITYPNCKGQPVAFSSTDGEFRAPEYTIMSAPDTGQAPYTITYVDALPEVG